MIAFPTRRQLLAATVFFCAAAGCGGSARVQLQGSVSYDGKPIDNGTIAFVPDEPLVDGVAKPKTSAKITDGKYLFEPDFGPFPGKYKVEVTWDKKTGKKVSTGDADMRDETKQMLPEKFNSQTTLTAEVKDGEKQLDFALPK